MVSRRRPGAGSRLRPRRPRRSSTIALPPERAAGSRARRRPAGAAWRPTLRHLHAPGAPRSAAAGWRARWTRGGAAARCAPQAHAVPPGDHRGLSTRAPLPTERACARSGTPPRGRSATAGQRVLEAHAPVGERGQRRRGAQGARGGRGGRTPPRDRPIRPGAAPAPGPRRRRGAGSGPGGHARRAHEHELAVARRRDGAGGRAGQLDAAGAAAVIASGTRRWCMSLAWVVAPGAISTAWSTPRPRWSPRSPRRRPPRPAPTRSRAGGP